MLLMTILFYPSMPILLKHLLWRITETRDTERKKLLGRESPEYTGAIWAVRKGQGLVQGEESGEGHSQLEGIMWFQAKGEKP